jgi:hypothetical protein
VELKVQDAAAVVGGSRWTVAVSVSLKSELRDHVLSRVDIPIVIDARRGTRVRITS